VIDRLAAALADRYRIERELGQGGMATVYLAQDLKHDRRVALKVLRPELAAVIGAERFLQEIRTTANLQHPHILPLHDSGQVDGTVFYVMPYIEGESLRDRLTRDKQLPIDEALRVAREVADALGYAHERGIIHRDIKPENILLQRGHALVADFGIALAATSAGHRMTETGMSLGTPHYMSPEQAMGDRELTPRSDVYALGAMTYEMLLGEPPFTGPTAQSIVAKVMTEKPAPLIPRRERIPQTVEDAVLTALEKLPADRFESAAKFAEALTEEAKRQRGKGAKTARPWLKDWRSVAVIGVALVASVLAVVFASRSGGEGNGLGQVTFLQKSFESQAIFRARFGPDGQTMVYSAALQGNAPHLYVVRPDFPLPSPLGPERTQLLAVSSKGELAVLLGARYLAHQLFVGTLARMPLGAGAPRELLADVREADWSPDGAELAIIHEVNGKDRLEFPIGKMLYEAPGYLSDLRVSPSGDAIALFEHPNRWDDRGEVILVDRAGRRTLLAEGYDALEGLAWTPDGKSVLYSGSIEGEYRQVHTVDRRGGQARLLLPSPGVLTIPDVAVGGRWLATSDVEQDRIFARLAGARGDADLSWLDRSQRPQLLEDGKRIVFTSAAIDAGNNYSTMLRRTDGAPAVRLGEGGAADVSPDGRWALALIYSPPQLMLYPTGPGQARRLDHGEFQVFSAARFFPDGERLLVCGNEPGKAARCYVRPLGDGPQRPLTLEGTDNGFVSPDGQQVVAHLTSGSYQVYPVQGGAPRSIPSLGAGDEVLGWSPDSRALRIRQVGEIPVRVEQLDLVTGRRSLLVEIAPPDRAGVLSISRFSLGGDPGVYAYQTRIYVSQLFVVDGMR